MAKRKRDNAAHHRIDEGVGCVGRALRNGLIPVNPTCCAVNSATCCRTRSIINRFRGVRKRERRRSSTSGTTFPCWALRGYQFGVMSSIKVPEKIISAYGAFGKLIPAQDRPARDGTRSLLRADIARDGRQMAGVRAACSRIGAVSGRARHQGVHLRTSSTRNRSGRYVVAIKLREQGVILPVPDQSDLGDIKEGK